MLKKLRYRENVDPSLTNDTPVVTLILPPAIRVLAQLFKLEIFPPQKTCVRDKR